MAYGAKVVLPTDLRYGTPMVQAYQLGMAVEAQMDAIDLLEESRDVAVIRSAGYQQAHAHKVHTRAFQVGDLVLQRIQTKNAKPKLSKTWEGPYLVAKVLRPSVYQQQEIDGATSAKAWNIEQLRKLYPWLFLSFFRLLLPLFFRCHDDDRKAVAGT
jgi:hypothetical protein